LLDTLKEWFDFLLYFLISNNISGNNPSVVTMNVDSSVDFHWYGLVDAMYHDIICIINDNANIVGRIGPNHELNPLQPNDIVFNRI
jgi:hypothetical protein